MTPMNVLPPVPAVWGDDWEAEWLRRLETNEPWVLTWLRESTHGDYWDHGSVRLGGTTSGYERIRIPTMIVAGWADGYRNNTFRTVPGWRPRVRPTGCSPARGRTPTHHGDARPPHRLRRRAGRLVRPLAARRGSPRGRLRRLRPRLDAPRARPRPARGVLAASAVRAIPSPHLVALAGTRELPVIADVGTAAWIDCAGHLPWGCPATSGSTTHGR